MASVLSKRQQARNERTLQELIKTVPGNDRCADCQARNPGWASWNLGIFLCMRCASLHRKLGTHISKVKSLSMDSWSQDQVENMKKHGNTTVNKILNPRNIKPPIPIDADEADSAMERFIRQKYESKVLEDGKPKPPSRLDPSYKSVEDSPPPPPLPPKPSRRFGFGLGSFSSHGSNKSSPRRDSFGSSTYDQPLPNNKPSRSLGFSLSDSNGSFESKLNVLRDMGFPDDKRNSTVLRGLNGDLDRTVETLVRLGEGSGPASRSRTPVSKTPTSAKVSEPNNDNLTPPIASNNPFDKMGSTSSRGSAGISINRRESQSTTSSGDDKKQNPYNPFDQPAPKPPTSQPVSEPAAPPLEQSFQNLQVSQPLFPHSTGGYPSQQPQAPFARYQQSMTPPITVTSQNGFVSSPAALNNGSYNPFFQTPSPAESAPGALYHSQSQNMSPTNPFFSQPPSSNPFQLQFPGQQQANPAPGVPGLNPPQHSNSLPVFSTPSYPQTQGQTQPQQLQPPQLQTQQLQPNPGFYSLPTTPSVQTQQAPFNQQSYFQPQVPNRMDKSSILALYSFSKPPPTIPEQPAQQAQPAQSAPPSENQQVQPQPQTTAQFAPPTNNSTTAAPYTDPSSSTNRNPFFNSIKPPAGLPSVPPNNNTVPGNTMAAQSQQPIRPPFPRTHMSQESIDIRPAQSGRHSPDIFANLSSRYVQ